MTLNQICAILVSHCIVNVEQEGEIVALMECCHEHKLHTIGEWERFDVATTRKELYDWLGY